MYLPSVLQEYIDVDELKEVIHSPPNELEHLELELGCIKELSVCVVVVDALLWCFRPQSLTLRWHFSLIEFKEWIGVIKARVICILFYDDVF